MDWVNAIVQGVLLGGLYALFATGLSLIFGVMRVVNLAHGVLTLLAAFVALVVTQHTNLSPLLTLPVVIPLMFALGYVLQRWLINLTFSGGVLAPLLVSFGIAVIVENTLLKVFSADSRGLDAGSVENTSIHITGGLSIGWLPLTIFLVAVTILAGLQLFFDRTMFGRAMRATSDDHEAAQLMAINDRHVYAIAMGIALAIAGIAGVFVGVRTTFSPLDGSVLLIFAFEAVIIGGLGSLWGTLVGGVDPRRGADARGARVAELVPALGSPGVPRGAGRPADRTVRATRERDVSRSISVRHSTRREPMGVGGRSRRRAGARARAGVLRRQRVADALAVLLPAGVGRDVEPARRVRRARLDRPAGVHRHRRLQLVGVRRSSRRELLPLDPPCCDRGGCPGDPDGRARVPAARAATSRSGPGWSPRCTCC